MPDSYRPIWRLPRALPVCSRRSCSTLAFGPVQRLRGVLCIFSMSSQSCAVTALMQGSAFAAFKPLGERQCLNMWVLWFDRVVWCLWSFTWSHTLFGRTALSRMPSDLYCCEALLTSEPPPPQNSLTASAFWSKVRSPCHMLSGCPASSCVTPVTLMLVCFLDSLSYGPVSSVKLKWLCSNDLRVPRTFCRAQCAVGTQFFNFIFWLNEWIRIVLDC